MVAVRGKPNRSRQEAAAEIAKGAWQGTAEIVEAIAAERRYQFGWRPLSAAIVCAVRDLEAKPVWSGEAFRAWEAEAKLLCKARGDGKLGERMGLTKLQLRHCRADGADKPIALACAHYTLGLPMPVPAEDVRAFDDWFRPRFGGVERPSEWLGVGNEWLAVRLRGYQLIGGERVPRAPAAWLIRALDWMFTVGPITPYGEKPPAPYWPGQDLDEGY